MPVHRGHGQMEAKRARRKSNAGSETSRKTRACRQGEYTPENEGCSHDVRECGYDRRPKLQQVAGYQHPQDASMDQGSKTTTGPVLERYWQKQARSFVLFGFPGKVIKRLLDH